MKFILNKMKKYHNFDNKKFMIKLEKPRLLHILSNNKFHQKINSLSTLNKIQQKSSLSPLVLIKNNKVQNNYTNNNIHNNYANPINNNFNSPNKINNNNNFKDKTNNIMKTTPLKYQYKKLPFDKVKGLKIKLPSSILNNKRNNYNRNNLYNNMNFRGGGKNTHQNYYPIPLLYERNLSTIQSNTFSNTKKEKSNKKKNLNINYYDNTHKNNITKTINNYNNLRNNRLNTITNYNIDNEKTLNNNTIQEEEMNKSDINKKIIIFNDIKKPLYQPLKDTKSSSIGSKLETREESGHFLKSRSKSSINSPQLFNNINNNINNNKNNITQNKFSFLKFNKLDNKIKISSKKKILKYLDKTIKQLTKIKTIILDEKDCEEYKYDDNKEEDNIEDNTEEEKIKQEIKNKYIKIDLDKIGKNLEKFKNRIDIDKNTINISYEGNNYDLYPNYNANNKKEYKNSMKKLNKTITYDDLKCGVREKQKLLNMNQKNFKNFKKISAFKRNKSEKYYYKYNTLNDYNGDYFNYKRRTKKDDNNYRIKNFDTEVKIPQLNLFYTQTNQNINGNNNTLNKINEEDNYLNNNKTNENQEKNNISDLANFEFSD